MQEISLKKISTNECSVKCSYSFNYTESNSVVTKVDNAISLSYDAPNNAPVTHNNIKYHVSGIGIIKSIHDFGNNSNIKHEIIVEHKSVNNNKNKLRVCIPLIKSSAYNTSVSDIITTNNSPTMINLQDIIPKKPYFFYIDENAKVDYIVYDKTDAIAVNTDAHNVLTTIIDSTTLTTSSGNDLYYVANGPSSTTDLGNGLYISCQPTGSSEELMPVKYDKKNITSYGSSSSFFDNAIFADISVGILSILLFGFIIFLMFIVYSFSTDSNKLFNSMVEWFNPKKQTQTSS